MKAISFITSMTMMDGQIGTVRKGIAVLIPSVLPEAAAFRYIDRARLFTQGRQRGPAWKSGSREADGLSCKEYTGSASDDGRFGYVMIVLFSHTSEKRFA